MNQSLHPQGRIQEGQYSVPYHYLPRAEDDGFSQTLHWPWGMRYLAGLEAALAELERHAFSSLIDVGCGDGRLLRELARRTSAVRLLGVDISERAVSMAKALNPELQYQCVDLASRKFEECFDIATIIEVLEHVPPRDVDDFLAGVSRALNPGGRVVLTVPHVNKPVQPKHFEHFSSETLETILSTKFAVEKIVPFDRQSRITTLLLRLLGGNGERFVITEKRLNRAVYERILRHCLTPQPESRCGRLLAVARLTA